MKLILFTSIALIFSACTETNIIEIHQESPKPMVSKMIKKIPIPIQEKGYQNLNTEVFTNQNKLNLLLNNIKNQKGWNRKKNFLNILNTLKIDFEKENLLLYKTTEIEGTVLQSVDLPMELNRHISIHIGKNPSVKMTSAEADYAFAYIIDKKIIDIRFNIEDKNITIKNR